MIEAMIKIALIALRNLLIAHGEDYFTVDTVESMRKTIVELEKY